MEKRTRKKTLILQENSIMTNMRALGQQAEKIVENHYKGLGYQLLERNYTIPGGELDLIFDTGEEIIFIEVKRVDFMQDFDYMIAPRKIALLERTIDQYSYKRAIEKPVRLDVVFVKNDQILEKYENVTGT